MVKEYELDGVGSWSFGNYFARNVVIFGVNNISLIHTDNHKNDFLVLGEGHTDVINDSIGTAATKFSVNFIKANTKFSLSLHHSGDENYLHVNKTEI